MRLRLPLLGLAVLLSVVSSGPLFAQQLIDSVTVEVVDVPVFVSRNGAPVEGLTREDFELYVNGKRHPIDYFDVGSSRAVKEAGDLRERRLFLLLFDLAFTDVHSLGRAQKAALTLAAQAPAGDLFAVGTYSARRGVRIASPFTRNQVALSRAIGSLASTRSGDPLALVMTRAEVIHAEAMRPPEPVDVIGDELPGNVGRMANAAQEDIAYTVAHRSMENQVLDLSDLAARLASLQGQKHVVLLSNGFDGRNRRDTIRVAWVPTNFETYQGGVSPALEGAGLGGTVMKSVQQLGRSFQASDVFLHTVDVEGVSTLDGNQALFTLARRTGGQFIHNENNLGSALARLSANLSHSYVLGFVPRNEGGDANRIEVRVRNARGARVDHRRGFSSEPMKTDVTEGLYLADVVMNDVAQTGTAAALSVDGGTLSATVPMIQLAAQVSRGRKAELLVYFFDDEGGAVDFRREVIEVPVDAKGDMTIALAVPEGATVAKALLRVNGSLGFSKTGL
jgi:VWFA-related protein